MSKFHQLLEIKQAIRNVCGELTTVISNLAEAYPERKLEKDLQKIISLDKKVANETFKVLVIGEFSTGKSSFINTLLGEDILPTDDLETTATINIIKYGENKEVEIRYWGDRNELGEEIKEGVCERKPLDEGTLKRYTTSLNSDSNSRAETIKTVTIFHNTPLCKDEVEIVDTPGLNTTIKFHEQATLDYLEHGHCALMVFKATQPFTKKELNYIKTFKKYLSKFFIVVNKVDLLKEDFYSERNIKSRANKLNQIGIGNEIPLYPISCLLAQEKSQEAGGITKFLDDFKEFLASSEKNKHTLIPVIIQASGINSSVSDNLTFFLNSLSFSSEEFESEIREIVPKLEQRKKEMDDIGEKLERLAKDLYDSMESILKSAIKDFTTRLKTFIYNYSGDIDDFEEALTDYVKQGQIEIGQFLSDSFKSGMMSIQEYMAKKRRAFQNDLNISRNSISDVQISRNHGVSIGKDRFNSDDFTFAYASTFGAGTLLATVLISPVLLVAPLIGPFIHSFLKNRWLSKKLGEFADVTVPEIESKLMMTIPSQMIKLKESFNAVKKEYLAGMIDEITKFEQTIEAIRQAQKQKQNKIDELKESLKNRVETLNEIKNRLSKLQNSIEVL